MVHWIGLKCVHVPAQIPVEHNIQLPCPVNPHSASALLTMNGLLFLKVTRADASLPDSFPAAPGSAPQVPVMLLLA